jgi:hypothetical protein
MTLRLAFLAALSLLCGGAVAVSDLAVTADVRAYLQAHVTVPEFEQVRLASSDLDTLPGPSVEIAGAQETPGGYAVVHDGDRHAYAAPGGFVQVSAVATGGGIVREEWSGNAVMLASGGGWDVEGGPDLALTLTVVAEAQ